VNSLQKSFKDGCRLLVAGKLTESLQAYREILWKLTLAEAASKQEEEMVVEMTTYTQQHCL
jgi:hypothetical protein